MQSWRMLPISSSPGREDAHAIRLNALGSLFFFVGFILTRHRLASLHKMICKSLETEDLHLVMELPMGHFKTTLGTEGLPIWWALNFSARDEFMMRELGYDDEWIRWMHKAHNPNTRTLIVHETDDNACAKGRLIDWHYKENDRFRRFFPEVIPDGSSIWNDHSKFQRRNSGHEQGTYEYRGVGSSLQGIHVDGSIEDDLVGKAATDSLLHGDARVMNSVIEYHGNVGTRFDPASFTKTGVGKQLVIGNRWAHKDLNSYIKENQPEFNFETHSAEGGCCALHPAGQPIFPEEYTMDRLATERNTLGPYRYSHFYLNQSIMPEDVVFDAKWLRYYKFKASMPDRSLDDPSNFLFLEHEVVKGEVIEDIPAGCLDLRMIVDPNHAGKRGRCKHAISVVGYDQEKSRFYELDEWSDACGYRDFCEEIFKMAYKWGILHPHIETVAAQIYLKLYLEELNARKPKKIYFEELPRDNRANAKSIRIESLEPYLRNGQFYFHRTNSYLAIAQISSYYRGKDADIDLLDTLSFAPQLYNVIRKKEIMRGMQQRLESYKSRVVSPTGY